MRGNLPNVNKKQFLENLYEYTRCTHLAQPTIYLDKEKSSKANARARRNGLLLMEEVWGEKGMSYREAMTRYAEEIKFIKELGEKEGVDLLAMLFGDELQESEPQENESTNDGDKDNE